jgi:hypothetical protein
MSVIGMRRVASGTEYTLENGAKVVTRLHTTVGWATYEAPIIIINGTPYENRVPLDQIIKWKAKEAILVD